MDNSARGSMNCPVWTKSPSVTAVIVGYCLFIQYLGCLHNIMSAYSTSKQPLSDAHVLGDRRRR